MLPGPFLMTFCALCVVELDELDDRIVSFRFSYSQFSRLEDLKISYLDGGERIS